MGLTFYVYPGANHNRFQHAMGAAHLMNSALDVIGRKGLVIDETEREAALAAILLHDIGHGPFSHTLENSLVPNLGHERLSLLYMEQLNKELGGFLEMAMQIFQNKYHKSYLHQLVSSQLDMDRLDYLRRDSFFTGVTEGVVGSERIIKMLRVLDDQLVVDHKGIYSIEKFLISRRLMYWQVYLHKTVLAAELMLIETLKRARELASDGEKLFATPALKAFLYPGPLADNPLRDPLVLLDTFSQLDDNDIFSALKVWSDHPDRILSLLSAGLVNRQLFGIRIERRNFEESEVQEVASRLSAQLGVSHELASRLVLTDQVSNNTYQEGEEEILFYDNKGQTHLLSESSDIINVPLLSRSDQKYYLCHPKLKIE